MYNYISFTLFLSYELTLIIIHYVIKIIDITNVHDNLLKIYITL